MAKKELLFLSTLILCTIVLSSANADFTISKKAVHDIIAIELSIPMQYDVTINNEGSQRSYEFVSLVPGTIEPRQPVVVPDGKSVTIPVYFLPSERVRYRFNFEFFVRDDQGKSVQDSMFANILPVNEIVSIKVPVNVARNDASMPIIITNSKNIDLGNVVVFVNSVPVTASTSVDVPANSEVTASVPLALTNIKVTEAGSYPITVTLQLNNEYNYTVTQNSQLTEYSEIFEETKIKRNFFGYEKTITRRNNGNIKQLITVEYKYSSFIEKSFTSFNIEPNVRETGKSTWQKQLAPGETFTIISNTNYAIPIIILMVIFLAIIAYILFKRRKVIVSKKALRVKTKGGEFAVKVVVLLKNISSKEVANLTLVDRLPLTTKLYEKFGSVQPDQIDKNRVTWKFPMLLPGEEIVTSYIIYSKIDMVGTIELPSASLTFTGDKGKKHTSTSNKLLVHAGD
jgi:hypothetical protein